MRGTGPGQPGPFKAGVFLSFSQFSGIGLPQRRRSRAQLAPLASSEPHPSLGAFNHRVFSLNLKYLNPQEPGFAVPAGVWPPQRPVLAGQARTGRVPLGQAGLQPGLVGPWPLRAQGRRVPRLSAPFRLFRAFSRLFPPFRARDLFLPLETAGGFPTWARRPRGRL